MQGPSVLLQAYKRIQFTRLRVFVTCFKPNYFSGTAKSTELLRFYTKNPRPL